MIKNVMQHRHWPNNIMLHLELTLFSTLVYKVLLILKYYDLPFLAFGGQPEEISKFKPAILC